MEPLTSIDTDVTIDQLISERELGQLVSLAEAALGAPLRVVGLSGEPLAGSFSGENAGERIALSLDFEPLVYLEAEVGQPRLKTVAKLMEWNLSKQHQYRMTSTLHTEIVRSDYEELQERNHALQASQARYKALSEQLEARVDEQVKIIKAAERQLYQKERMASVGQLAAGVAHEINNPIGFVSSNLQMASEYVGQLKRYIGQLKGEPAVDAAAKAESESLDVAYLFEDFNDLLSESREGCDRVTKIVKNLKDFSSIDVADGNAVNLNDLINSVVGLYENKIPESVKLILRLGDLPLMPLNGGHISQVILNLLTNAMGAFAQEGGDEPNKVGVSTHLDEAGGHVVVRVTDNGAGIPVEAQKHIFDPFFTTKPVGQGTGLGLSVCRDIVLAHEGEINIKSEPRRGTLVVIKLPVKRDL